MCSEIRVFCEDGIYTWAIKLMGRNSIMPDDIEGEFPTPESALADAKAYLDHVVLGKPYRPNIDILEKINRTVFGTTILKHYIGPCEKYVPKPIHP